MKIPSARSTSCRLLLLAALVPIAAAGCIRITRPGWMMNNGALGTGIPPQGTLTDPIWIAQAENAEPAKFMMYQHEFVYNQARMNWGGEDHLKQVAARLHAGQNFPVLIERSVTSKRTDTDYKYPVHLNPELDMQRRAVVVASLTAMGVAEAEQKVVVAPSMVRGMQDGEAERSYYRSMFFGGGMGGFGGGFGGFGGGMGGFGGGGGGFGT